MSVPFNRCFNVRDQVLQDESVKTKFRFKTGNSWHCSVTIGSWVDPYTGSRITDPRKLDIDHMVPLKEAHESGAYRWSKAKRREYANYLEDPGHLLAVSLTENRRKGDRDPPNYLPPNTAYHCTYLREWVAVKRRWDLSMDPEEAAFVRQKMASC